MAGSDVTAGARDMAIPAELVKLVDRIEELQQRVRHLEDRARRDEARLTNALTESGDWMARQIVRLTKVEQDVKALSYAKADA